MWTKSDRDGFIQMLVHRNPTAGQGGSEFGAFELPDTIAKAHRVIPRYDALVLQREN
jgi:hypothetical protein